MPSAASVFEYVDETAGASVVPSVTSVGPSGGLESSPRPVTVYGSGFIGASQVTFGGVPAASFQVKNPFEITVTPPVYSTQACAPLPTTGVYLNENATNDICQVQVVVSNAAGSSATSANFLLLEGAISFDSMGAELASTSYEIAPQPTEYDYVPAPTITSVSTGSIADLNHCLAPATTACNAGQLASETGGPANLITIKGTGMNGLTLDYALIGAPNNENSIASPVSETGTSIQVMAPVLIKGNQPATTKSVERDLSGSPRLAASSILANRLCRCAEVDKGW